MNILFTGVGRRIELLQAFRSAALVLGKRLKIFGADLAGTAPALSYCDRVRRVVAMRDPGYIANLLEICRKDAIDLLIPTIDTDLLVLSEHREEFEAIGTRVMISAPDKIRICRDKNVTSRFFVDCGLHAPLPVNDWRAYTGGYPAFIKPKDGSSSINAFRVGSEEELKVYAERVGDYVIQPFVTGREYTIDVFCDWDGNPVHIVPRERLQVREGEVLKTRICMDGQMIAEAKTLCEAFRPRGPMTVQLIRDSRGVDWFIEINPRYGGGAPLSMKAGAKSAETVLRLLDGETVEYTENAADGAVYSRFDQSVAIEEGTVPADRIRGVIFDLDDTLYRERDYVRTGYKAVSDYLGGGYEEELWSFFEAGTPAIDRILKRLGREDEKERALAVYRAHQPRIRLYEGAEELIRSLKAKGIRVGIITDGRPEGQRNKLRALGLEELVEDILVTDELGGEQFRKPCDIAFRILQTRWRMRPEEIVYVGDNPGKDFQAPRQLGMKGIWLRNPESIHWTGDEPGISIPAVSSLQELRAMI